VTFCGDSPGVSLQFVANDLGWPLGAGVERENADA
jgi:hypothetical protein